MDQDYREVDFAIYCPKCEHEKKKEREEPCASCLARAFNYYTSKPVLFEKKKKK